MEPKGSPTLADLMARLDEQSRELERLRSERAVQPIPAQIVALDDSQRVAAERAAKQREAQKREHPIEDGALRHKQMLRDGTVVMCREKMKDGNVEYIPVQIQYRKTPEGKLIVGGQYDGKFM